jgi:dihydrofolate reductase
MAKLIYSAIASVDGYIADEHGNFDWAEPDAEVHAFINDLEADVGTYLYGRRMYEVMTAWETLDLGDQPGYMRNFAEIWRNAEKIVYSSTLESTVTDKTRLERQLDPEAVRSMKQRSDRDLTIGGPTLAAHAFKARLIDECHFFLAPALVGGGQRSLPERVRMDLELVDERRFAGGMVYVRYRAANWA